MSARAGLAAIAFAAVAVAAAGTCTSRSVERSREALREAATSAAERSRPISTPVLEHMREALARTPDATRCLEPTPRGERAPDCRAALARFRHEHGGGVRALLLAREPEIDASSFRHLVIGPELTALLEVTTRVPALAADEIREALARHDLGYASATCAEAIGHGVSVARRVPGTFGSSLGVVALNGVRDACAETLGALPPADRIRLAEAIRRALGAFPTAVEVARGERVIATLVACGLVASEDDLAALPEDARAVVEVHRNSPDPLGLGVLDPALRTVWARTACHASRAYVDAFLRATTATDAEERGRWERIASWYAWLPGASDVRETLERIEQDLVPARARLDAELR